MQENGEDNPIAPELGALSTLIEQKSETFACGSRDIQAAALDAAKYVFDLSVQTESISRPPILDLLSSLAPSAAPQTRSRSQANATKHSPSSPLEISFPQTPITSLFVEGMDDDQIWAQLDLRTKSICELLDLALEGATGEDDEEESDDDDDERDERLKKALEAFERGEDPDIEGLEIDSFMDDEEEGSDEDDDDEGEDEGEGSEMGEEEEDLEEGVMGLHNESSDEDDDDNYEGEAPSSLLDVIQRPTASRRGKSKASSELDDDFFDLASFNAETEQAEAKSTSRGHLGEDDDSEDDNMSVDLFAPVDDTQHFDEDDLENNPGEAFYRDFFEPPKKVAPASKSRISEKKPTKPSKVRFHEEVRVKKIKAKGKNLPLSFMDEEEGDDDESEDEDAIPETEDMQLDEEGFGEHSSDEQSGMESEEEEAPEIMQRLNDDLFAEDDEEPSEDLTTHEKRMSALREQIAELEAENVAPKEWMLQGEAGSRTRPQNSLLEEDLEFERVMKPAPVITEETVKTLEERIKARILDNQFDDVVRVRALEDKPFLPSRFFELQDAKSSQSLAQIYENEYVASQTGGTIDDRDGKLQKEHEEIEQLWEKICGKLDALCNAHFVPKQPKATISTISNVSTATLESALPTAKSLSTMLAPEEVFEPSSSEPRARSELTPAEKRALRTKERKAKKKQRDTLDKSVDKFAKAKSIGGVKKQKQAALESVVKHGKGVTVVGKKGKDILAKKERKSRT